MTDHGSVEHESPDLVGLLTGELPRDQTLAAARHLEGCAKCAHELADIVVAHAALRSSSRVSGLLEEDEEDVETAAQHDGDRMTALLPPLSPLDTTTPEAGPHPETDRSGGATRRQRARLLAVAAILVLLVVGSVIAISAGSGRGGPTPVASAALQPIEAPTSASGSVSVFADGATRSLTVETHQLPQPAPQRFYEVWLLDPTTRKMLPMGVLSPSGRGNYSVSAGIMAGYSAVDVSLQSNDGDPAHSETSVLRAQL